MFFSSKQPWILTKFSLYSLKIFVGTKRTRNAQKIRETVVVDIKNAYVIYEWSFKARMKNKRRRERQQESNEAPAWLPRGQFAPQALGGGRGSGPGTVVIRQVRRLLFEKL